MPQKKSWPNKFLNIMHGFKSAILAIHGFKSAILAEWKNCQNGTFEPVHEIQNFFLAKRLLLGHYESAIYKKYP